MIETGYPPTINAPPAADHARRAARSLGLRVIEQANPSTDAEDFAFYSRSAAIAFAKLGADRPDRPSPPLHTDAYDFNNELLPLAASWLAAVALDGA